MDLMTCPWCSTRVVAKADNSCPACQQFLVDVDPVQVAEFRQKRQQQLQDRLRRDAATALRQSIVLTILGLILVLLQTASRIELGNGWSLRIVSWGLFLLGIARFVQALQFRKWFS